MFESVDLKKQLIKVRQLNTLVTKTIHVPGLLDAKLNQSSLLARSQDCMWQIDINTGESHRLSYQLLGLDSPPALDDN
jgi:hypothetical protein